MIPRRGKEPEDRSIQSRASHAAAPHALRALGIAVLVTLAWCGPAAASSAETRITLHAASPALAPGSAVAVSWGALPEGVEEFELLLQCSEPARVTLRLTESLDPELRDHAWTVPNLPCERARLLIRVGIEGEESIRAASAPFRIEWDRAKPPPAVASRDGELWLAPPHARETWIVATDRFVPGEGGGELELAPTVAPREFQPTSGLERGAPADGRCRVHVVSSRAVRTARPLTVPLRI